MNTFRISQNQSTHVMFHLPFEMLPYFNRVDMIRRYKFLAFDFDEMVEVSRENCRLLLIRLKMEGWIIGKNKVFLRYYDKEYLSRYTNIANNVMVAISND